MSNLGLGVMIGYLSENGASADAIANSKNKKITDIYMVNEELCIQFDDNKTLHIWDNGQSCCEHRYMTTDDSLKDFIGSTFIDVELRDGPEIEDPDGWGGTHEQQFLLINTSFGTFTMVTHNNHNGYYGGFYVTAREESTM